MWLPSGLHLPWSHTADGKYSLVNIFTIVLTHALMLLAAWRLLFRDDLDRDSPVVEEDGEDADTDAVEAAR